MCDYCDCRTRPVLDRLGRDHERITALAGRLRRAVADGDGDGTVAAACQLQAVLEGHDRIEEEGLYRELARVGVPTVAMQQEHEAVDAVLHDVVRRTAVDEARVLGVAEVLEDHIRREEYDLFPAAHQLVDDAGWDRIEAAAGAA